MKVHSQFRLNGKAFTEGELRAFAVRCQKSVEEEEKQLGVFLMAWLSDNNTIALQTSGSTGTPKIITVSKAAMHASAERTGAFFKLRPGNSALLCLPIEYIAGKMMVVRALVLGLALDTIPPKTKLDIKGKHYDFTALIPMQAETNFNTLHQFKTVLIGGAPVSAQLRRKIAGKHSHCVETYGMTETLTHVAKRHITDPPKPFRTMPDVTFLVDHDNCLLLSVPYISGKIIHTNDVVERIEENSFHLLGRRDFVINSGGKKLFPEQLEEKLDGHLPYPFFFGGLPDALLGEKLVLYVECPLDKKESCIKAAKTVFDSEKHQIPKEVICMNAFIYTDSGKLRRRATMASFKL